MNSVKKLAATIKLFAAIMLTVPFAGIVASQGFSPSQKSDAVVIDALIDGDNIVELIGVNPVAFDSDGAGNLNNLLALGFESMSIVRRSKTGAGALDTNFNTTGVLDISPDNLDVSIDDNYDAVDFTNGTTYLMPGKILHDGSNYYVLSTSRYDGTNDARILLSKINDDENGIEFTRSLTVPAYGGNGKAMYRINDAVVSSDNNDIFVAFSMLEDPDQDDSAGVKKGYVAVAQAGDSDWQTPLGNNPALDGGELLSVVAQNYADDNKVYAAGYNGTGAIVQVFNINATGNTLTLDTSFDTNGELQLTSQDGDKAHAVVKDASGNLYVAVANKVQVDPVLKESISVYKLDSAGAAVSAFGDSGVRTYYFDPLPQMTPISFDPVHPEYEFENAKMNMILDADNNALFVTGTLTNHGLPFVYKLDTNGAEANYSKNFKHIVNKNDELVQALVDSPVHYPVVGQSWMGSVHGVYASALDAANNWLYLFGAKGTVDRNIDPENPAVRELAMQDVARRVTTGNLTITGNVNNVKMNAMYSEQEIQVQVMDGSTEGAASVTGNSADVSFANFRVYSNPVRYETVGDKDIELYGTVEVTLTNRGAAAPDITSEVVVLTADSANALGITIGKLNMAADPAATINLAGYDSNKQLLEVAGLNFDSATDNIVFKDGASPTPNTVNMLAVNTLTDALALVDTIEAVEFNTTGNSGGDNNSNESANTATVVKNALKQFLRGYANFRLHSNNDHSNAGEILDENNAPTVDNGGVRQGMLVGTMADGTAVELTIASLELVDKEMIAIASEVSGSVPVRLINNYGPDSHTISIDNDFLQGTTIQILNSAIHENEDNGGTNHTSSAQLGDVKLDVIEAANPSTGDNLEDYIIFGYVEVKSSEFGSAVFPVHGQLKVQVQNHKLNAKSSAIAEGDISALDNPTGSYIQGRTQFGRLSLALQDDDLDGDAVMHREIRDAATVEAKASLTVTSNGSQLTISALNVATGDTLTDNFAVAIDANSLEIDGGGVTRAISGTGQQKMRIKATATVKWINVGSTANNTDEGEPLSGVPVGGDLIVGVDANGAILSAYLDNFTMSGKKTVEANNIIVDNGIADVLENHGLTTVHLRVHPTVGGIS